MPKTVGEYEINFDFPVSFLTAPGTSFVFGSGHISVREVTDTHIQAGISLPSEENFGLNGVFQMPICP